MTQKELLQTIVKTAQKAGYNEVTYDLVKIIHQALENALVAGLERDNEVVLSIALGKFYLKAMAPRKALTVYNPILKRKTTIKAQPRTIAAGFKVARALKDTVKKFKK